MAQFCVGGEIPGGKRRGRNGKEREGRGRNGREGEGRKRKRKEGKGRERKGPKFRVFFEVLQKRL